LPEEAERNVKEGKMLTVGQKLWFVPYQRRVEAHEVIVEKVGRKWASIGYYRINIDTLKVDGGQYSSPGACYLSKEAYEAEIKLNQEWDAFRRLVDANYAPKGITIERIKEAINILGI
jgi:hypothetical protein